MSLRVFFITTVRVRIAYSCLEFFFKVAAKALDAISRESPRLFALIPVWDVTIRIEPLHLLNYCAYDVAIVVNEWSNSKVVNVVHADNVNSDEVFVFPCNFFVSTARHHELVLTLFGSFDMVIRVEEGAIPDDARHFDVVVQSLKLALHL